MHQQYYSLGKLNIYFLLMVLFQHAKDFGQECSFRKNFNPSFGPLSKDLTMHKCNTYILIIQVFSDSQRKQKQELSFKLFCVEDNRIFSPRLAFPSYRIHIELK